MLEVNQTAPDFSVVDQDGEAVSLAQFQGDKHVVLYFYPKDDTPGCTTEANEFTALIDQFAAAGAVVLGVSKDSCEKHRKFIAKHDLKVRLLHSETDSVVPYETSVEFEATLAEAGYDVKLIPFSGGHSAPFDLTVETVMEVFRSDE